MPRGEHRVYLGAAPGVGKTFAMLNEGARRHARGSDVVIGWFQEHGRAETTAKAENLERVPPRRLAHRGAVFEEMDVDAVIARRPELALVDELAHTNAPGSRNEKRWQDVEELLEAGISVISTVNIQHLESVNDVIERITGVRQGETLPDAVVRAADEIELVDVTPEVLRRRLARGDVYEPDKIDAALTRYFRPGNLAALRELALLWVADRVEEGLETYADAHGIDEPWETRERVVVAVSGRPGDEALVRRAARMAGRGRGELIVAHVAAGEGLRARTDPTELERLRRLTGDLGGAFHELAGGDVAESLLAFARDERATQLVLGASTRSRLAEFVFGSVINTVNRGSGPIDVHIISEVRGERAREMHVRAPRVRPGPTRRQRRQAAIGAVLGLPLLTVALIPVREEVGLAAVALLYMATVVLVALRGGTAIALGTAIASALLLNFFFTEPLRSLRISDADVVISVLVFVAMAALVGLLVSRLAQRSAEAETARREAQALAFAAGTDEEQLPELIEAMRVGFGLRGVLLSERVDGEQVAIARAGEAEGAGWQAEETVEVDEGRTRLSLSGRALTADDRRVLGVLTRQLAASLERRRLRAEAADAELLAASDRFRTALLRAVSHDLRTPLASIKAAVGGLLRPGEALGPADSRELLLAIDSGADRLDRLIGNLLDMSRLESGVLTPKVVPIGLDELVPALLAAMDGSPEIRIDVDEALPRVLADPGLLERAAANVLDNAVAAASAPGAVTLTAGRERGGWIALRVSDDGPGIPAARRDAVFAPFQRLDDAGRGDGLGLGLAIARGFTEAMGGRLELEDTPTGGLTVSILLPAEVAPAPAIPPDGDRA